MHWQQLHLCLTFTVCHLKYNYPFRFPIYVYIKDKTIRAALSSLHNIDSNLLQACETYPAVHSVLQYLQEFENLPTYWFRFIQDVSTASPVTAYIHDVEALQLYVQQETINHVSSSTLLSIKSSSPIIFNFLQSATPEDRKMALPIINDLKTLVKTVLNYEPHDLPFCNLATSSDSDSYFPTLPQRCMRGHYNIDKLKNPQDYSICKRKTKQKGLHGVFLVHCPHGK